MKTRLARQFFLVCLMLLIGNLNMMAKRAHVERGMTKQQGKRSIFRLDTNLNI